MIVEVCANSLESAINAQKAGADRVELCVELAVGGLTPSYGLLRQIRERITIPIHVLVRPRSGDFTYSDLEFDIMRTDIELCRELGFEGVVSGVLLRDGTLDVARTQELVELSRPMAFVFHRAFDWVKDPFGTLGKLEAMGVDAILTSGQQRSSVAGLALLSELRERAERIVIMPGGGVRDTNVLQFKEKGFQAVHLSGVRFQQTLDQLPEIPMSSPDMLRDNEVPVSDLDTLREVVRIIRG